MPGVEGCFASAVADRRRGAHAGLEQVGRHERARERDERRRAEAASAGARPAAARASPMKTSQAISEAIRIVVEPSASGGGVGQDRSTKTFSASPSRPARQVAAGRQDEHRQHEQAPAQAEHQSRRGGHPLAQLVEAPAGQQRQAEHQDEHHAQVVAGLDDRDVRGELRDRPDAEHHRQQERAEQRHADPHARRPHDQRGGGEHERQRADVEGALLGERLHARCAWPGPSSRRARSRAGTAWAARSREKLWRIVHVARAEAAAPGTGPASPRPARLRRPPPPRSRASGARSPGRLARAGAPQRTQKNTTVAASRWKFDSGWPPKNCSATTAASPATGSGAGAG